MSKSTIASVVFVLALVLVLAIAGCAKPEVQTMGVTNFDSIHLSDLPESTATPVLLVNEQSGGSANVVEVRVAETPVWYVTSAGAIAQTGGLDLNGAKLTMDADGNTSLTADTDNQIDVEVNGADDFRITANTLTALSGSSLAANTIAETTAASGVTIDGLTLKDGGVQDSAGFPVTGVADANQLVVTGYTTQTNKLLTLEQSGGTDKFTVDNSGNLVVVGTSDLQGNVSDSGGALTVTDNAAVTGQADAEQLVVTGYTTQTNSILVVENSSNTDIFEVTASQANLNNNPLVNIGAAGTDFGSDGSLTTAQTVTVSAGGLTVTSGGATITAGGLTVTAGGESIAAGDLEVADNGVITGTLDVDGAVTLNGTLDVDGNISSGTDAITMTDDVVVDGGLVDVGVGSYTNADGDNDLGVAGDLEVDTGIYGDSTLDVDGAVTFNSTLDVDGNLSSGTGVLTITDGVLVDGGLTDIGAGTYTLADGDNDLGIAGDAEVDGASNLDGNVTLGGTLTLESVVFSGPTVFGVATNIANNGTIAHGMATTPTIAIVMPLTTTATITNVPYVKSLDATNITVVVPSGVVTTFDQLMWIAGK